LDKWHCKDFVALFCMGPFINDVTQKTIFLGPLPLRSQIFFCMEVSHSVRPPPPKNWTSFINDPYWIFWFFKSRMKLKPRSPPSWCKFLDYNSTNSDSTHHPIVKKSTLIWLNHTNNCSIHRALNNPPNIAFIQATTYSTFLLILQSTSYLVLLRLYGFQHKK